MKISTIAAYAGAFIFIVAMVFLGYKEPQDTSAVANAVDSSSGTDTTSVDDVVAVTVAANIAQSVNLPVATSVANLAISTQAQSDFTQSSASAASKPQIITSSGTARSVTVYAVKSGDTVDSLASKFGISKNTIKWTNNLIYDTLSEGDTLKILPIDGVLYTVKSGDTIKSIAEKYSSSSARITTYNNLEVSGIKTGMTIILPDGVLPEDERPGYVAVTTYAGTGTGFGGSTWYIRTGTGACSGYTYGNCTCYAYSRRIELGLPVGSNWGNASSWAWYAAAAGYTVNNAPSVGAIMQSGGLNSFGHVAIVESIAENGDLTISEMNAYVSGGGWNIVSGRIVFAGNVGQYLYIH